MKLIVAPHADDETLGCGGIIARDPEDVVVVILADKDDGRMEEFHLARKILGYERYVAPAFRTGSLAADTRAVTSLLDAIIRAVRPSELYLPTPGAHQDHITTYECGIRSARMSYTDSQWFVPSVLLYDVPSYTATLYDSPYRWSRFVSLTADQLATKMSAIRAYDSQSQGVFDPADLAQQHAHFTGSQVNQFAAEQFAVIRETIA